jgi:hypothetical protein
MRFSADGSLLFVSGLGHIGYADSVEESIWFGKMALIDLRRANRVWYPYVRREVVGNRDLTKLAFGPFNGQSPIRGFTRAHGRHKEAKDLA